jgi:hypothetical protein
MTSVTSTLLSSNAAAEEFDEAFEGVDSFEPQPHNNNAINKPISQ